jgi:hypothetical protein
MLVRALRNLARASAVAALTMAASTLPIYAVSNDVSLRIASARCEKERLRQRVAQALHLGRERACVEGVIVERSANLATCPGSSWDTPVFAEPAQ